MNRTSKTVLSLLLVPVLKYAVMADAERPLPTKPHELISLLDSTDRRTQARTIQALSKEGPEIKHEAFLKLKSMLGSDTNSDNTRPIQFLAQLNTNEVTEFLTVLAKENSYRGNEAISQLGFIQNPTVIPTLIEILNTPEKKIRNPMNGLYIPEPMIEQRRSNAVMALQHYADDPHARKALEEAKKDRNENIRFLARLDYKHPERELPPEQPKTCTEIRCAENSGQAVIGIAKALETGNISNALQHIYKGERDNYGEMLGEMNEPDRKHFAKDLRGARFQKREGNYIVYTAQFHFRDGRTSDGKITLVSDGNGEWQVMQW